jgi:hypothetical protein
MIERARAFGDGEPGLKRIEAITDALHDTYLRPWFGCKHYSAVCPHKGRMDALVYDVIVRYEQELDREKARRVAATTRAPR